MTRPLRRVHACVWLVLIVVLPALLAVAIAVRPAVRSNPDVDWERFR